MAAAGGRTTGHTDIAGDRGGRVASRPVGQRVEATADLDGVEAMFLPRHSSSGTEVVDPLGRRGPRVVVGTV